MNNKTLIAYVVLLIAPSFTSFRGPAVGNENDRTHEPITSDVIFQSKDGGRTWEDISYSLPVNEPPQGLFTGTSELYLRVNNKIYRSKSNLKIPIWQQETALDPGVSSVTFNPSGAVAFSDEGKVFRQFPSVGWSPFYVDFGKKPLRGVFETSGGTYFLGCDAGIYKSTDNGKNWRQVSSEGGGMHLVEADGVLLATSQSGIIRSTDNGDHWETVISEGGVGITVERIDGGFAAIAYSSSNMSRRIYISMDGGATWKAIDEGLRPALSISSIKQIGNYLICGHPDGIFRSADMGRTWNQVHATFSNPLNPRGDGQVFKIHVSGNVLYAVKVNSGC